MTDVSPEFLKVILKQKINLVGLPISPSENSMYPTFNGRRIKSKALVQFQRDVNHWRLANKICALQAREICQLWIKNGYFLKVSVIISFEKSQLFTKDGRAKQLDASNRIKGLHDAIAEYILAVDDRYFWSVSIEKVVGTKQESNVTIEPILCQFFDGSVPQKAEELSADPQQTDPSSTLGGAPKN